MTLRDLILEVIKQETFWTYFRKYKRHGWRLDDTAFNIDNSLVKRPSYAERYGVIFSFAPEPSTSTSHFVLWADAPGKIYQVETWDNRLPEPEELDASMMLWFKEWSKQRKKTKRR